MVNSEEYNERSDELRNTGQLSRKSQVLLGDGCKVLRSLEFKPASRDTAQNGRIASILHGEDIFEGSGNLSGFRRKIDRWDLASDFRYIDFNLIQVSSFTDCFPWPIKTSRRGNPGKKNIKMIKTRDRAAGISRKTIHDTDWPSIWEEPKLFQ